MGCAILFLFDSSATGITFVTSLCFHALYMKMKVRRMTGSFIFRFPQIWVMT